MAYEYKTLTAAQREGLLQQRLAQLEAEHFNHEMNKAALSSVGDSDEKTAAIEQANAAQATIEAALDAVTTELGTIAPQVAAEAEATA